MSSLTSQLANCLAQQGKVPALLESIRLRTEDNDENIVWYKIALQLASHATNELEMQAVHIETCLDASIAYTDNNPVSFNLLKGLDTELTFLLHITDVNDALIYYCFRNKIILVKLLLLHPLCEPSCDSNRPIIIAATNGFYEIVESLLQYSGPNELVNPSYASDYPLCQASTYGHLTVVNLLLQDPRVNPNQYGGDALIAAAKNGHLNVINRLLQDSRIDPAYMDSMALVWASENNHLAVVDRLLQDPHIDPCARNQQALRSAASNNNIQMMERIMQKPEVNLSLRGSEILRNNAIYGHTEVVRWLLQYKGPRTPVNPADVNGHTITIVQKKGYADILRLLLSCSGVQL